MCLLSSCTKQGRNRNIFLRGQINFSWFFSRCEMLFPGRKFPFWLTQNKFQSFLKSEKQKKKKKKRRERSSPHSSCFNFFLHSIFIFQPSLSQFSFFPAPISLFSLPLSFPNRSAEISRSEVSGGHSAPLPPPCYATGEKLHVWPPVIIDKVVY